MSLPTQVNEIDAITEALQSYMDGGRSGKGSAMKPSFHAGELGDNL